MTGIVTVNRWLRWNAESADRIPMLLVLWIPSIVFLWLSPESTERWIMMEVRWKERKSNRKKKKNWISSSFLFPVVVLKSWNVIQNYVLVWLPLSLSRISFHLPRHSIYDDAIRIPESRNFSLIKEYSLRITCVQDDLISLLFLFHQSLTITRSLFSSLQSLVTRLIPPLIPG